MNTEWEAHGLRSKAMPKKLLSKDHLTLTELR